MVKRKTSPPGCFAGTSLRLSSNVGSCRDALCGGVTRPGGAPPFVVKEVVVGAAGFGADKADKVEVSLVLKFKFGTL